MLTPSIIFFTYGVNVSKFFVENNPEKRNEYKDYRLESLIL